MAAEGIQIRVDDSEVLSRLASIGRVADRPADIMSAIAAYMVTVGQRNIERETGPDGRRWVPLAPRTAAARIGRTRLRGSANMLRVTNRLYSSISGEATATQAIAGTNAVQAAALHFGATIQMPAREQDIHLGKTNRGKRFVRASAKRKETMRVKVGAHTITIPARPFLYLDGEHQAEILLIAEDGLRAEAGAP